MALSDEQIDRYSRQILVPEIGGRGQERLLGARVACLGSSPSLRTAIDYLRAAGIAVSRNGSDAGSAERTVATTAAASLADEASDELPLMVLGQTARTVWYTRGTATSHCRACLAQRADALAEPAAPPFLSAADVAGAALALDIIADLLGIGPAHPPDLISMSRGGLRRQRIELDFSGCTHTAPRRFGKGGD
jgi:hypothetical protein